MQLKLIGLPHFTDFTGLKCVVRNIHSSPSIPDEQKYKQELEEIRRYKQNFKSSDIKVSELEFHFARSSGPGGQNVNKVNSKAILNAPIEKLSFLSQAVKIKLRQMNQGRINKMDELIIQSDRFRTQLQNKKDCLELFHGLIQKCLIVPNETSNETKKRVGQMMAKDKREVTKDKQHRSKTKEFRRKDF